MGNQYFPIFFVWARKTSEITISTIRIQQQESGSIFIFSDTTEREIEAIWSKYVFSFGTETLLEISIFTIRIQQQRSRFIFLFSEKGRQIKETIPNDVFFCFGPKNLGNYHFHNTVKIQQQESG